MEEKIIKKLVNFIIANHYNSNRAQIFQFVFEKKHYEVYAEFTIRWDIVSFYQLSVNKVIKGESVEEYVKVDFDKIKESVQREVSKIYKK